MQLYVSAIQLEFEYASSPQKFYDRIRVPIELAAAAASVHPGGAPLIVLPNYTGWQLLGIAVPVADEKKSLEEIARKGGFDSVSAMLLSVAPTMRDFFVHLFASLAQQFQVYLAPGTVIERERGKLFNAAYLFGPDGRLIGAQRQTHRALHEIAWGLSRGDDLKVFDIGSARVGFVIGADVEYPEVARILALQSANVLIHPAAYTVWRKQHLLLDLWRDVQANQAFGVQACLAGGDWKGQSAIYAPVDCTADRRGFLAQTSRNSSDRTIGAALDFEALQKAIDAFPIFDFFNYDFYTREFPQVYRETR